MILTNEDLWRLFYPCNGSVGLPMLIGNTQVENGSFGKPPILRLLNKEHNKNYKSRRWDRADIRPTREPHGGCDRPGLEHRVWYYSPEYFFESGLYRQTVIDIMFKITDVVPNLRDIEKFLSHYVVLDEQRKAEYVYNVVENNYTVYVGMMLEEKRA